MSNKKAANIKILLAVAVLCIALLSVAFGVVENQRINLQEQNASLQNQLAAKTSTINSLDSEITYLNATIDNLDAQVSSQNKSITSLQKELSVEETIQKATETELANQRTSNQQTLNSVQSQLVAAQNQAAGEQAQIASLNSEITNLQNQIAALNQNTPINGFSIVQITDTQYLSQSAPDLFNGLTSWVANSTRALNLKMVVHTGDIVNIANQPPQWANANNAMMTFYNDSIPYTWNCGNHEDLLINGKLIGDGNPNTNWLGGNYPAFNVAIMRQEPYWVADLFNGKSTVVQFSYNDYRFMIINVEYNANNTVLDWMQTLIKTNPTTNIIVATHNFLNGNGTYGTLTQEDVDWGTNFAKILNNYPNVFMTLNGHDCDYGPAYHMAVGNREQIFFNRQEIDNETGAATARIYTFDMRNPANPNVIISTYQTYGTPQYLLDTANQFNFSTNLIPYSNPTINVAAGTDFIGSSGYSINFTNPASLQSYRQVGDQLTFTGLAVNNVTSSFTASAIGANVQVTNFNSTLISYNVSGNGTQTFSTNAAPASVKIDGVLTVSGYGWTYSNGGVTVTTATSEVEINLP